jgi:ABC-2 type transport system permease protein
VSAAGRSRLLGTGTPARPASWTAKALALTLNELRLAMRRAESLLVTFVIPAGVLLVFSAFDVSGGGTGGRPVDRMLPGSMSLAVIAASMTSLAIATGFERSYGVIKRLGGSPAGTSALVASKTAAVVVVEAVQAVLLVLIAMALGWSAGPTTSPGLTVAGLVLGTVAFAGLGLLMAGTLRAEATLALANLLFLVALVVGGIVVPLDRLPATLAAASSVLPPAALTRVLTVGLGGAAGDATEALVVLAVWAVVLAGLAARKFRWD